MSFWVFHFKRFGEKTTNHARSRNSSVALKPSVCEKEYLVRLATPQDGRKKDLTRKTCKRPSSLEEDSFSSTGFVDCLASSGLCWFPLVSIYGWFQSTICFSARMFRQPALPRLVSIYGLFLRADVSTACPAPLPPVPPLLGGESESASNFVSFVRLH